MRLLYVAFLVLLAGCVTDPAADVLVSPTASRDEPAALPNLAFTNCDELDFYQTGVWEEDDMGGLQTQYVDPARLLGTDLFTAMRCDRAVVGTESVDDPVALFYMVAVDPDPTLQFSNVSAYVWIGGMLTDSDVLRRGFGERLRNGTGPVALSFSSLGSNAEARASLRAQDETNTVYEADSVMSGSPEPGSAGTMAAYIGNSTTGLELFLLSFSNYTTYSDGVAVVGADLAGSYNPEPWLAYHNLDYDVVFARLPADT